MNSLTIKLTGLLFFVFFIAQRSYSQNNIAFDRANFPESQDLLRSAKKALFKGHAQLERQRYDQALTHYETAKAFNANNALLNFNMGLCHFNLDQHNLAAQEFEHALKLDSQVDSDVLMYLARSLHLTRNFEAAGLRYKELLDGLPDNRELNKVKQLHKYIAECESGLNLKKMIPQLTVENLGDRINSEFPDYGSFEEGKGTKLFFTSNRKGNYGGEFADDIYFSESQNGHWSKATNIGKPINTEGIDVVVGMDKDDGSMYLYANTNGGDIYRSLPDGRGWSEPLSIDSVVNSFSKEISVAFADSGDTIFFISDRPGGMGGGDIYMSQKGNDDRFANGVPLAMLNSPFEESSLFFDNGTLYFASEGHNSMGGYDIFRSEISNGQWSDPINLGSPINSPYDDIFYTLGVNCHYFSSDRSGGQGSMDIYSVSLPINIKSDDLVSSVKTDSVSDDIVVKTEVSKPPTPMVVSNILFGIEEYQNETGQKIMDILASFLKANPTAKVLLTGHADATGKEPYNLWISQKRVEFVGNYLIAQGVDIKSFNMSWEGSSKSAVKYIDSRGMYMMEALKYNRRVEIEVIVQGNNNELVIQALDIPEKYYTKNAE